VPIRILIADDHVLVRSGVRALLAADPDLEVVGEAGSGEETLRLAAALGPDLVLLDITMPEASGIATAERLKEAHPDLVVLFLTMHEDEGLLHEALRTGAAGYVIKRAEAAELLQAIRAAMGGDIYVHPAMTRGLLRQPVAKQSRRGAPGPPLTPREIDVLRLLVRGNTNRQIAGLLGLSPRTVESHRANLIGKLGLESRVELVDYAEEHGLV
jgi:DNA-binding NarL/FixJ family response regulator